MKVLLVYATNSGSTQAASIVAAQALTQHHEVTVQEAQFTKSQNFNQYDAIVLASPTWDFNGQEGQLHEDFIALIKTFTSITFENKLFAVIGLGDSSYTHFCAAADHLEKFVKSLKGKLVIPTLRIDSYYLKEENSTIVQRWAEDLDKILSAS